jgi:hypothetical protein
MRKIHTYFEKIVDVVMYMNERSSGGGEYWKKRNIRKREVVNGGESWKMGGGGVEVGKQWK